MKLLEGGGQSDFPFIRILVDNETLRILRAIRLRKRHSSDRENHGDTACGDPTWRYTNSSTASLVMRRQRK